jgi:hypothetical protein
MFLKDGEWRTKVFLLPLSRWGARLRRGFVQHLEVIQRLDVLDVL